MHLIKIIIVVNRIFNWLINRERNKTHLNFQYVIYCKRFSECGYRNDW